MKILMISLLLGLSFTSFADDHATGEKVTSESGFSCDGEHYEGSSAGKKEGYDSQQKGTSEATEK